MPDSRSRAPARRWWSLVAVLAVVLLVASVVPVGGGVPSTGDTGLSLFDTAHVVGYAALGGALAQALLVSRERRQMGTPHAVVLVGAVLVAVAYGVGIEVVQGLLGPRSFGVDDMMLNAVGACLGVAAVTVVRRVGR
jgi:VanZ family protein